MTAWCPESSLFHLSKLDALAAQLDLPVRDAAKALELSVGSQPSLVTGPVETTIFGVDKGAGRLLRPVQVPIGKLVPPNGQFPDLASW